MCAFAISLAGVSAIFVRSQKLLGHEEKNIYVNKIPAKWYCQADLHDRQNDFGKKVEQI